MRKVLLVSFEYLVTVTNHWWNGVEASLIITAVSPSINMNSLFISFLRSIPNTRIEDEIDWMIKYFMDTSEFLNDLCLFLVLIIEHRHIVFSSRKIQINIQEFTIRHTIGVTMIPKIIMFILIPYENQIANLMCWDRSVIFMF